MLTLRMSNELLRSAQSYSDDNDQIIFSVQRRLSPASG